jgi:AbrB family looped-hinge helix DNA binding protein
LPYLEAMTTLTVTAKGQVTLRKEVLEHMGVKAGDRIAVTALPHGRVEIQAVRPRGRISDVFGILKRDGGATLTVEEINDAIAEAAAAAGMGES